MNRRARKSKRKSEPVRNPSQVNAAESDAGAVKDSSNSSDYLMTRLESWVITLVAAVFVATTLQPTEQAFADGSNSFLCLLCVLLPGLWLFVQQRLQRSRLVHFTWSDIAICVFALWLILSTAWHLSQGDVSARQAINSTWQWIAGFALYWIFRELAARPQFRGHLLKGGIVLACFLSVCGLYQFFYEMPIQRQAYLDAPEEVKQALIRAEGISEAEQGTRLRQMFENRLNSKEPLATFGLANSLAVVISSWFVVGFGLLLRQWKQLLSQKLHLAIWIAGLAAIAFCLVLTKSRTAYLATGLGMFVVILWVTSQKLSSKQRSLLLAGTAGVFILLGIVAAALGTLDIQVITEAGKSLTYRVEYWRASLAMIFDHPIFGVGAGNFQDAYTHYKLPTSSETVADPHQFLIEIASNIGLVGAFAFLSWMGLRLISSFLSREHRDSETTSSSDQTQANSVDQLDDFTPTGWVRGWWLGIPAGIGLAALSGPLAGYEISLPMAVIAAAVTLPFAWGINSHAMSEAQLGKLAAIGGLAIIVNLLASGGVSFLGVNSTLWLIFACVSGGHAVFSRNGKTSSNNAWPMSMTVFAYSVLVLSLLGAIANYQTHFFPVVQSRLLVQEARSQVEGGDIDQAIRLTEQAAEVDPYSATPSRLHAYIAFQVGLQTKSPRAILEFEEAKTEWINRRPNSSLVHHELGNWYLNAFGVFEDRHFLQSSTAAYQSCLEMDPTNILVQAQLAANYSLAEEWEKAKEEANKALEMSERSPHADLKLENRKLQLPSGELSTVPAEQLMDAIRSR